MAKTQLSAQYCRLVTGTFISRNILFFHLLLLRIRAQTVT